MISIIKSIAVVFCILALSGCSGEGLRKMVGDVPDGNYSFTAYDKDENIVTKTNKYLKTMFDMDSTFSQLCDGYPSVTKILVRDSSGVIARGGNIACAR